MIPRRSPIPSPFVSRKLFDKSDMPLLSCHHFFFIAHSPFSQYGFSFPFVGYCYYNKRNCNIFAPYFHFYCTILLFNIGRTHMNRTSLPAPEQRNTPGTVNSFFHSQKYITTLDDLHLSVSAHWHEEAEFTRILSGSGTLSDPAAALRDVAAGDLLFIPPGTAARNHRDTQRGASHRDLCFSHDFPRRQHRGYLLRAVSDAACDSKADSAVFLLIPVIRCTLP